jgi:hypothetical protein
MKSFKQSLQEGNPLARIFHHAEAGRHMVALSAQKSDKSKKENEARHAELKKKITAQGYGHREVEGVYQGQREKSLVVHAKGVGGAHGRRLRKDMAAHAKHYGQDSILHHNGKRATLHYANGTKEHVGKLAYNRPDAQFQTSMRGKKKAPATFTTEERLKLTEQEFQARQADFLEFCGPNTGNGFFGKWAWDARKRHEFRDLLRSEGYDIAPEVDVSDAVLFDDDDTN